MKPLTPRFPLDLDRLECSRCDGEPERKITRPTNPNGNAGRPYYICSDCGEWITWYDDRGVHGSNPNYDCGIACRQDRAGANAEILETGLGFWTCASGSCGYFAKLMNGLTDEE
jgi:hypothetical protein